MLFDKDYRDTSRKARRIHATFEIAYTIVDLGAALCFVVGSVMFLSDAWQRPGTWLFIVGSLLFAVKPTLRFARELRLAAMGDTGDLAERESGKP